MAYPAQATAPDVTAAGLVRLTGLAARYLYLKANYQPVEEVVGKAIDLRQKIEALAVTADVVQQGVFLCYLGETYDLPDGIYTDPVEHAKLPPVPATGAEVRPFVLRVQNGKVLRIQGGKLLGLGYRLVPNAAPVYNTSLAPTGYVDSVTYNGLADTLFSLDGPIPTIPATGRFLRLFVGLVQVGRVDFPSTLDGQGFSLLYNGATYYSTFQAVPTNEITLS